MNIFELFMMVWIILFIANVIFWIIVLVFLFKYRHDIIDGIKKLWNKILEK